MNEHDLDMAMRNILQQGGLKAPTTFTPELRWIYSLFTKNGTELVVKDSGMQELVAFVNDPSDCAWGNHLRGLRPQINKPRVLLFGRLGSNQALFRAKIPHEQAKICGLNHPEFQFSDSVDTFWKTFFNCEAFFTNALDIPALIVSPGYSRFTAGGHVSVQTTVTEILEKVAKRWNIPLFIKDIGLRQPSEIMTSEAKEP